LCSPTIALTSSAVVGCSVVLMCGKPSGGRLDRRLKPGGQCGHTPHSDPAPRCHRQRGGSRPGWQPGMATRPVAIPATVCACNDARRAAPPVVLVTEGASLTCWPHVRPRDPREIRQQLGRGGRRSGRRATVGRAAAQAETGRRSTDRHAEGAWLASGAPEDLGSRRACGGNRKTLLPPGCRTRRRVQGQAGWVRSAALRRRRRAVPCKSLAGPRRSAHRPTLAARRRLTDVGASVAVGDEEQQGVQGC
jgi:hypothetical protein